MATRTKRRRFSAKQRAWQKKFAARYGGGRKRRRTTARRANPNPRRRSHRRTARRSRRNYGTKFGHMRGVRTTIRKHRKSYSRLKVYALNPRRRRRASYRRRGYRRNPGLVGGLTSKLGTFKQLFNKDFMVDAAIIGVGSLATPLATAALLRVIKKEAWGVGIAGYGAQLVTAGLIGSVVGMAGKPALARKLMLGGVAGVMAQLGTAYLLPKLGLLPGAEVVAVAAPAGEAAVTGFTGLGLTDAQRMLALPSGINDFAVFRRGVGDFISTGVSGLGGSFDGSIY